MGPVLLLEERCGCLAILSEIGKTSYSLLNGQPAIDALQTIMTRDLTEVFLHQYSIYNYL